MTTRTVTYCSSSKLACSNNLPAEVILCLDASLVAPHACMGGDFEGDQTYAYRHIEASLTDVCRTSSCETGKVYKYTFEYDDVQLEEYTELLPEDIEGVVCKGCFTKYVEDLVGEEISVSEDAGEVTITSQHGCSLSFATGLADLEVTNTESVLLTYSAPTLSADVQISLDAGNQLS